MIAFLPTRSKRTRRTMPPRSTNNRFLICARYRDAGGQLDCFATMPDLQSLAASQVRVEHDWYYLAAQKGRDQDVTLRRGSSNPIRSTQALDSNGVWRIHLVQVTTRARAPSDI